MTCRPDDTDIDAEQNTPEDLDFLAGQEDADRLFEAGYYDAEDRPRGE